MPDFSEVVTAWDEAARGPDARQAIHPAGSDPAAYEESGRQAAKQMLELFGHLPDGPIVDFGAGDGRVILPLAGLTDRTLIAVDSSAEMLSRLAARSGDLEVAVFHSDGRTTLPKAAGVYALAVLIHHDHEAGAEIFAHLAAALVEGGKLILNVPLYEEPRTRSHWADISVWTLLEMEGLARLHGLRIISTGISDGAFDWGQPLGRHHDTCTVLLKP